MDGRQNTQQEISYQQRLRQSAQVSRNIQLNTTTSKRPEVWFLYFNKIGPMINDSRMRKKNEKNQPVIMKIMKLNSLVRREEDPDSQLFSVAVSRSAVKDQDYD